MRLPSGVRVRVRVTAPDAPLDDDVVQGRRLFAGRFLNALRRGVVAVEQEGAPIDVDRMELRDFHALRDVAERAGVLHVEPELLEDGTCRNCGEPIPIDPSRAPLEGIETWYDDEPEPLRPPFPLEPPLPLPGGAVARDIDVRPVTVRRARALWRALVADGDFEVTEAVVRALGVRALGRLESPKAIARALASAPDEVWEVVETLFVLVNYPARAFYGLLCEGCGAVHEVPTPSLTEHPVSARVERLLAGERPGEVEGDAADAFPDRDEFEDHVERIGGEVYGERGVRNIALQVSFEVPPVDDAGEPLLGSYQPRYEGETGTAQIEFLISLYYFTFLRMWEEDGPYDVLAEIRETIDHEVEHHLYHLAGHDPMDEEERRAARRDLEHVFGRDRVRRAERAATVGELARIARLGGIFLALFGLVVWALHRLGVW